VLCRWCPHCKSFAPTYEKIAKELARRGSPITVARVDATVSPSTSRRFGVRSFPSIRLIKGGKVWEFPADKSRSVVSVVEFADGGYESLPSSPVPAIPSVWSDVSREAVEAWADILALVRSKPNAMVLAISAGFVLGMLVMLGVAILTNWVAPLDIPPAAVDVAARRAAHQAVTREEAVPTEGEVVARTTSSVAESVEGSSMNKKKASFSKTRRQE
jgi:thiol-disulfide isomerase/thioredoxin